jgi:hypothetical protein
MMMQALKILSCIALGFGLMLLRAWPRLLYPEVWIEDGSLNIYGFINEGIANFFGQVGGYLVLVPKLITFLSLSISFFYYPWVSTLLAWAFCIFVFVVIARAPTYLKGSLLLAIACFLIPSDIECFGLPMYSFWWTAPLLFILIFWKAEEQIFFRLFLLTISSLSSPVCLITLPLFWLRTYHFKKVRGELLIALFASLYVAIQIMYILLYSQANLFNPEKTFLLIPKFLGAYAIGNIMPQFNWLFGIGILTFLLWAVIQKRSITQYTLSYLLLATIGTSIYRVDITILNHIDSGVRYFFLPFILLSWLLIQIALDGSTKWIRVTAIGFLTASVINMVPVMTRTHARVHWTDQIFRCLTVENSRYDFPILHDGSETALFYIRMTGDQCRALLEKDALYNLRNDYLRLRGLLK